MEIILHRINSLSGLISTPKKFGVEIDIRAHGSSLILNHEPGEKGDNLVNYLDEYRHGTLVLNIKEAGIEKTVLDLVKERGVSSYFLLDVEMPFIFMAAQCGVRELAIRYSEYEPIESAEYFANKFDWVWIDTVTCLPLDSKIIPKLESYKTCVVCPERWGRPDQIMDFKKHMQSISFAPDAVMTTRAYVDRWLSN